LSVPLTTFTVPLFPCSPPLVDVEPDVPVEVVPAVVVVVDVPVDELVDVEVPAVVLVEVPVLVLVEDDVHLCWPPLTPAISRPCAP
jgi:hypothetical protein